MSQTLSMGLGALVLAGLLTVGCDAGIHVVNVGPEITAVGPVTLTDGRLEIYLWVRDHEEDAVDLDLEVSAGGGNPGSKTVVVDPVGGHGSRGLTSSNEPTGRLHVLNWTIPLEQPPGTTDPNDRRPIFDEADVVKLAVTPTDRRGAAGPTVTTEPFGLQDGLPAP